MPVLSWSLVAGRNGNRRVAPTARLAREFRGCTPTVARAEASRTKPPGEGPACCLAQPVYGATTRFPPKPDRPDPQSQSFSRSYGSILPTSLIYIILSTRGCSPWRPDAVMSTTWQDRKLLPCIFKDRHWRAGHHETCGALPASEPYLRMIRFQGLRAVKKKRELFPGPMPMSTGSLTLPSAAVSR